MMNDRQITISIGSSRMATNWQPKTLTIEELYGLLRSPRRGTETLQEYMHLSKDEQATLKDVGGFVGGTLRGARRKAADVTGRDLITLDFDNIPGWKTDEVVAKVRALGCGFCIYSTRKHDPAKPRLRIIIPLDRTVTPDEYEPCARRVAAYIGIGMADKTTFEPGRLMYWPSCCADSEYVFVTEDAPLISAEFLLSTYIDWHDMATWPLAPGETVDKARGLTKQDPTEAKGLVGQFCRTYDIYSALEKFLPGVYVQTDNYPDRLTFVGGSTSGGAIVYNNGQFLFSHHATDPCCGQLVNAWDLVRLHLFGELDAEAPTGTRQSRLPSYQKMEELAAEDEEVLALRGREFREELNAKSEAKKEELTDDNWTEHLDLNKQNVPKSTIDNVLLILEHDPELRGKFAMNEFSGYVEVTDALPWNAVDLHRIWADADSSGLYWYLETKYGYKGNNNVDCALDIYNQQHAFNPVVDYLKRLHWDGVERLDTLLIDYLGAQDTKYNRTVCRKAFTAAVARAMNPGCKYDNMLILAGKQGSYKSTILNKMSRGWFNDNLCSFEGKEASELLRGAWIVEVSELDALRKSDISRVKQFLSMRADRYRAAYGRHVKELPRCCVFFGSTNTYDFLRDMTGNRRFWPVDVMVNEPTKSVRTDLTDDVIDQMWAEATQRWRKGEELYLTGDVEAKAQALQDEHRDVSVREGIIIDFVEKPVPVDWQAWNLDRRRDYWFGATRSDGEYELVKRDRISAIEVWCEALNGDMRYMKNSDAHEINMILSSLPGWERTRKPLRFGAYGAQRGFVRAEKV